MGTLGPLGITLYIFLDLYELFYLDSLQLFFIAMSTSASDVRMITTSQTNEVILLL